MAREREVELNAPGHRWRWCPGKAGPQEREGETGEPDRCGQVWAEVKARPCGRRLRPEKSSALRLLLFHSSSLHAYII